MTRVFLGIEDALSEFIARRLLTERWGQGVEFFPIGHRGNGFLKSKFSNFIEISKRELVLLITDLDSMPCAPSLVRSWAGAVNIPNRMLFRVAVREVESWILADRAGFSNYLGVKLAAIPENPDALRDPKRTIVEVAMRAKRELKNEITPQKGSNAKQGFGYNEALRPFVEQHWSVTRAIKNSDSLRRTVDRIDGAKSLLFTV